MGLCSGVCLVYRKCVPGLAGSISSPRLSSISLLTALGDILPLGRTVPSGRVSIRSVQILVKVAWGLQEGRLI